MNASYPTTFLLAIILPLLESKSNTDTGITRIDIVNNIENKQGIMTETWTQYGCSARGNIDLNLVRNKEIYTYNKQGLVLDYVFLSGGTKMRKVTTAYENGGKQEYEYLAGDWVPGLSSHKVYTYNSKNQISECVNYGKDATSPGSIDIYNYNIIGKLTEVQGFYYPRRTEWVNGELIETQSPHKELSSKRIYTYDFKNYLIEETEYYYNSKKVKTLEERIVYINDTNGNPVNIKKYTEYGLRVENTNVYGSGLLINEREIKYFYCKPVKIESTDIYKNRYNYEGKLIERTEISSKGLPITITKISYEYY